MWREQLQRIRRNTRPYRRSDNKREIALLLPHPLWQNIEKFKLLWEVFKSTTKRNKRSKEEDVRKFSSSMMAYLCNCWETLPVFHDRFKHQTLDSSKTLFWQRFQISYIVYSLLYFSFEKNKHTIFTQSQSFKSKKKKKKGPDFLKTACLYLQNPQRTS